MILFLDMIAIIIYMLDINIRISEGVVGNFIGIAIMLTLLFFVCINKRDNIYVKLLTLLVTSLPMSYIGVMGIATHQIFSWYNLYLVLFIFQVLRRHTLISKRSATAFVMILLLLVIGSAWSNDMGGSYMEIAQIFAMLFPLVLIYNAKKRLPIKLKDIKKVIFLYADICVVTALGMLAQFVCYYYAGIRIGIFNITGDRRVSCLVLFRGASILPIFMGIGFLILLLDIFDNHITVVKSVKIAIIFAAMILNTSRTALAILFIIVAIILLRQIRKNLSLKSVAIAVSIFMAAIIGVNYILTLRAGLSGFLDANGRYTTWETGYRIWTATTKNFFLGEGFSGGRWEGVIKPHNMLIQTLAQCGVLVTLLVIMCFVGYFRKNRNNRYKYLPWYVLLSGMLVTDFYANAFATVIFMVVDIYGAKLGEAQE